jgi:hypothetical protein
MDFPLRGNDSGNLCVLCAYQVNSVVKFLVRSIKLSLREAEQKYFF